MKLRIGQGYDVHRLVAGRIVTLVREKGLRVVNCDLTLIAEAPKLSPYRDKIIERIARVLGTEENAVGLKATTNEGLGAIGRSEGMAAFAVVLLESSS